MTVQTCPICQRTVEPSARYPRYVCRDCAALAKSQDGRGLLFFNETFSGGYLAKYADTGETYPSHDCYIRAIKCYADEHRFGGIVIQTV